MFHLIQGCVRQIILEHTQPRLEVSKNQLKICVGFGCVKIPCLIVFQPLIFQGCVFVVNGCFVIFCNLVFDHVSLFSSCIFVIHSFLQSQCWSCALFLQYSFCSRVTFQLMHFCDSLISAISMLVMCVVFAI